MEWANQDRALDPVRNSLEPPVLDVEGVLPPEDGKEESIGACAGNPSSRSRDTLLQEEELVKAANKFGQLAASVFSRGSSKKDGQGKSKSADSIASKKGGSSNNSAP